MTQADKPDSVNWGDNERQLRRFLASLAEVCPDHLNVVERWQDPASDCEVFRLADGRRIRVTSQEMVCLVPRKDPMVEALEAVVIAQHEARKRATDGR